MVWALLEQSPAVRRLGFRAMQFNLVVSTNTASLRCWQRNGFQVVGTLPGAFLHKRLGYVDALVMVQDLVEGPPPGRWDRCGCSRAPTSAG